ncbi:MAG: hypothetical protein H6841_03485 [Planctomycetes bacterium]|nr:hypothetical protein [Planctomycetota bacterium]MCB9934182.1 hypothetical protein [Planctomycetota bacterium]
MRYLNRKWVEGGYDEFTTQLYLGVYLRHLEDIAPDAPTSVRVLGAVSQGQGMVGSQIAGTRLDPVEKTFSLIIKLQTVDGDIFMEIRYEGVQPDSVDEHAFEGVDYLLTDEMDLAPDEMFEHRILLSPEGEFAIRFKDLKLNLSRPEATGDE